MARVHGVVRRGIRICDTYGILTINLVLTLRNCGLNNRMHYMLVLQLK